jgi:hypothetical protein
MFPLSVPTLLVGGALEGGLFGFPFTDHANGEISCPLTLFSGTGAESSICSM